MSEDIIHVNEPLTSRKIMELLETYPDLKKITCPVSLYNRTSPKYLEALEELGITVEARAGKGRPKKYSDKDAFLIKKMLNEGRSPKEISQEMQIPVKSVYYLNKDSKLKRGRKSKYSKNMYIKVKDLAKKGVPRKEISKKLNIPLRTVYHILKNNNR